MLQDGLYEQIINKEIDKELAGTSKLCHLQQRYLLRYLQVQRIVQ